MGFKDFDYDHSNFQQPAGTPAVDPPAGIHQIVTNQLSLTSLWHGRHAGGNAGIRYLMRSDMNGNTDKDTVNGTGGPGFQIKNRRGSSGRRAPFDRRAQQNNLEADDIYPLITHPFKVSGTSVSFDPGTLYIYVGSHRGGNPNGNQRSTPTDDVPPELVQSFAIDLAGELGSSMPMPDLSGGNMVGYDAKRDIIHGRPLGSSEYWSLSFDGTRMGVPFTRPFQDLGSAGQWTGGSNRGRLSSINAHPGRGGAFIRGNQTYGDIVWGVSVAHGDYRLVAARPEIIPGQRGEFVKHEKWNSTTKKIHGLFMPNGSAWGGARSASQSPYNIVPGINYAGKRPEPLYEPSAKWQLFGDFDNGMGSNVDGPFINKVDEGNTHGLKRIQEGNKVDDWTVNDYGEIPYFAAEWKHEPASPSYFSPNRMMPSPVVFGSMTSAAIEPMPSGDRGNEGAWQTLLFRPNVSGGVYTSHPGGDSPPDHVLLDLFWMPIVEPYALSETLSTAGKVNLNYQILPFKHITRSTAMRGIFHPEYLLCVPNRWTRDYKVGHGRGTKWDWEQPDHTGELRTKSLRFVVLSDDTLEQFEEKFDNDEIFRSASEICNVHLVPEELYKHDPGFLDPLDGAYTPSVDEMANGKFWSDHRVTGDNSRERPYAGIYNRITTKSNTYRIHIRSQVLKQAKRGSGEDWTTFDPEMDTVLAEYRGSAIIERYIDPHDEDIPDYATDFGARIDSPVGQFYKYRVINEKRFAP